MKSLVFVALKWCKKFFSCLSTFFFSFFLFLLIQFCFGSLYVVCLIFLYFLGFFPFPPTSCRSPQVLREALRFTYFYLSSSSTDSLINKVKIETGFPCIPTIYKSRGGAGGLFERSVCFLLFFYYYYSRQLLL